MRMERRSRSTTRYSGGGGGGDFSSVAPPPIPTTGPPPSSSSGAAAAASSSLLLRPGGDSRTLSPDRRNVRSSTLEASQHRTGSYNQYTQGPPLTRLGLPSPRGQQQTSTPQASPIKYEDFSLPLKKATEKLSYSSTNGNINNMNNNNNHNNNNLNNNNKVIDTQHDSKHFLFEIFFLTKTASL